MASTLHLSKRHLLKRYSIMLHVGMVATMLGLGTASIAAPTPTTVNATAAITEKSKTTVVPVSTDKDQLLIQQQVERNTARLHQLEQANQDALARNQELQLMNDNLTVQVQVLQSERSAQMFLYGAATLMVGAFIGFLLANYMLGKRKRRW